MPPLAGLWKNGEPVAPAALNMTLEEVRTLLETVSLPIVEVKVPENKALLKFDPPPTHLRSEPNVTHPLSVGPGYGIPEHTGEPDPAIVEGYVEQVDQVKAEAEERDEVAGQLAGDDV